MQAQAQREPLVKIRIDQELEMKVVPECENNAIKIRTEDVGLYYGDTKILEGITLGIHENSVTSIIGPSGCGKTSYLRIFNRMNDLIDGARIEGRVELDGVSIYGPGTDVVSLRRAVGMLFQKPNPFPLSIFENVAYGPKRHGLRHKRKLQEILESCLKKAALWDEVKDNLDKQTLMLSGGQQQRLCLARVLAVNPDVLLMDEPCSALDPIATQKIEDLIAELKKDYTIIIVTHNMQQAARVSDYTTFFLAEGGQAARLIERGRTSEMFTNPQDRRTENYITGRFG